MKRITKQALKKKIDCEKLQLAINKAVEFCPYSQEVIVRDELLHTMRYACADLLDFIEGKLDD